jgi:hypothetical protein
MPPPIFPLAPPRTIDYSSNGTSANARFIPEVWSGKMQVKFYRHTVLSDITNNDWEGEIKSHGDRVIIRTAPDIIVLDYKKSLDLQNQIPDAPSIELLIDKGKYFSVILDDVDAVQSDLKLMDEFTNDAAEQMKMKIDGTVLNHPTGTVTGRWSTVVPAANQGDKAGVISQNINLGKVGAPLIPANSAPTGTIVTALSVNPLDIILRAGLVLDEQNVPETGRWIVLPAWMGFMLKTSDLKAAYLTGDDVSPIRNGKIGTVDRFTVYLTNNYEPMNPVDTGHPTAVECLFGTRDAISFASQITNVETLRSERTFGNIVRGLNVFGYGNTKPEAMGIVYVAQA